MSSHGEEARVQMKQNTIVLLFMTTVTVFIFCI